MDTNPGWFKRNSQQNRRKNKYAFENKDYDNAYSVYDAKA